MQNALQTTDTSLTNMSLDILAFYAPAGRCPFSHVQTAERRAADSRPI